MCTHHLEPLFVLGLALLLLALLIALGHPGWRSTPQHAQRRSPRPLRPHAPEDCPECRCAEGSSSLTRRAVTPYAQRKSPRSRKKTLDTLGYACPHPDSDYLQVTDASIHACAGYPVHPPAVSANTGVNGQQSVVPVYQRLR